MGTERTGMFVAGLNTREFFGLNYQRQLIFLIAKFYRKKKGQELMRRHPVVIGFCLVLISIAFAEANGRTEPSCFIGQNLTFEGKLIQIKIPKELPDFTLFSMRCVWSGEILQLLCFYQQVDIHETAEFVTNTYELFVFKNRPEFVALIFKEQIWIYEDNTPVPATKEELKSRLELYSGVSSKI